MPLIQYIIVKIQSPESFIIAHYEEAIRVVPLEPEALIRDLHSSFLLPAGLYMAVRQGEYDEAAEMRRVAD